MILQKRGFPISEVPEEMTEAGASEMSRTWPGRRHILMTVFAEAHRCVRT